MDIILQKGGFVNTDGKKYLVISASYEEKAKNTNPKVGKMAKAHNAQFKILNYNRESCIEIIPHSSLRIPNYFVSLPFNR